MTIQGSGMSSALRMYNNYTTRGTNNSQSEAAEAQENQEFDQQVAIEGSEPPDGKGVPRGKPPAGEGGMRGAKGAGGPPPKPPTEATDDEESSELTALTEEESLIETLLDLTATSSSEDDEDSSEDVLGLSTLEDLLQLTSTSDEISEEMQALMLKRFEDAYQNIQPPELNIDTDNDNLWSVDEISEFAETENLDVDASEIISNYDTDGDSMINSEEREAMRADNALNIPPKGPGGPGGPGGMPPSEEANNSEEDEEITQEEISDLFYKKFEAAYLNASRNYSEVSSYFDAVS